MAEEERPRGSFVVDEKPSREQLEETEPLPRGSAKIDAADVLGEPEPKVDDFKAEVVSTSADNGWSLLQASRFMRALGALAVLLIAIAVYDALRFLHDVYTASSLLGAFYSLLMLATVTAIGWWIRGIVGELRAITDIGQLRLRGESLVKSADKPEITDDLREYVRELSAHYRNHSEFCQRLAALPVRFDRFATQRRLDGREGISEISKTLYGNIDQQALDLVVKRSQQTALMTAISRMPLLDLIIVLWRSSSLIREIANLYGGRPGRIGLFRLARMSIYNVVYADVSQVAADIMVQAMGDRTLSAISAQVAQGVSVGLMLGRLGLEAIRICRPVPFTGDEQSTPSVRKLYSAMVDLIKGSTTRKPADVMPNA
jgi:putative membrane protein